MTFHIYRLCGITLLSFILSACAASPPTDVSQSAYLVRTSVGQEAKLSVFAFEVENDAPAPVPAKNPAFRSSFIPIRENTSATVVSDLNAYFAQTTKHVVGSSQKVVARIEQADAYWEEPVSAKLPVIGLFKLSSAREFFMNLRVSFEVEEGGKVLRTLTVSQRFSIPDGKIDSEADFNSSYQRLIAQYRIQFFAKLDRDFITRYLN